MSDDSTEWTGYDVVSRRRLLAGLGAAGAAGVAGCAGGQRDGGSTALTVGIIQDPGSAVNPYVTNNARWDWLVDLVDRKSVV